ncbi:MAG: SDR family oxidoreductase, partial [Candidatus Electrothrix sp. AR3]|nr:SDR family oxidoreductase [Candidatus Electrothrix sp. AR3]
LAGQTPFKDNDVLVVSGGARGVTAVCLFALAERQPLRFVLLGRSELPEETSATLSLPDRQALQRYLIAQSGKKVTPAAISRQVNQILAGREIRSTLDQLAVLGSEARYLTLDVSDSVAVIAALEEMRQDWGGIQGVVHAAGVLQDKAIVDMTEEQFGRVFRTKVGGLHALLAATEGDELKLLCCFSSIAARVGNSGQLNYNAANETLNRICSAEKIRRPDAVVKSIGWGAWDGGMVTPALKQHFQQLGVELIDPQTGAQAFVDELYAGSDSAVEVLLTGDPGKSFSLDRPGGVRQAAVWFHERNFPFLNDHTIVDVPVAAMFFIIELAARFAQGVSGQPAVRSVCDVKVYKGIQLPDFSTQGHWVRMSASTVEKNIQQIEFRDEQDRLNYRFQVETGLPSEPMTFMEDPAAFGSSSWDWDMEVIYSDRLVLFHSGVFKVVAELSNIDAKDFNVQLKAKDIDPEQRSQWSSDVLMADGAVQGAVLWAWAEHQHHVLPSGLEEICFYQPGLRTSSIHCYTRVVEDTVNQCRFDVWLVDEKNQMVASMKGLEMTCIPTSWIPEERKNIPIRLR